MAVSEWSRAIAVAAFVASYVGLALGRVPGFRIDRTGVAIIGATVMAKEKARWKAKHTSVKDVIKRLDEYSMSEPPPNLVSSVRHSHSFSSSSVFVAARTITLRHLIYTK